MRLLHTVNLTLHEFIDTQLPAEGYSILSHRWRDNEVSYQDFVRGQKRIGEGWAKIVSFCKFAAARGNSYVWIDTCCIDKRSSAELTEALNSMWQWYREANQCYAYLFDLPPWIIDLPAAKSSHPKVHKALRQSQWFTRAWTLQELLAPRKLWILSSDWRVLARRDGNLAPALSKITGIATEYLTGVKNVHEASIAMRMSWAARRQATVVEDTAYSLLGLFDVNMPLLYGERKKAFMRLQREIIAKSDDESIFAWTSKHELYGGLLAPWPSYFETCGDITTLNTPPGQRLHYQLSNKGVELSVPQYIRDGNILPVESFPIRERDLRGPRSYVPRFNLVPAEEKRTKEVQLACTRSSRSGKPLVIVLLRVGSTWERICQTLKESDYPIRRHEYQATLFYIAQGGM